MIEILKTILLFCAVACAAAVFIVVTLGAIVGVAEVIANFRERQRLREKRRRHDENRAD